MMKKILCAGIFAMLVFMFLSTDARTYDFKFYKGESMTTGNSRYFSGKAKCDIYRVKIGAIGQHDSDADMEIRAATVLKHVKSKQCVINDMATYKFKPDNKSAKYFLVKCGIASATVDKKIYIGGDMSYGYVKGGVIIELWQSGKCVKHWASMTGPIAKTKLKKGIDFAYIGEDGYKDSQYSFKNDTEIFPEEEEDEEESEHRPRAEEKSHAGDKARDKDKDKDDEGDGDSESECKSIEEELQADNLDRLNMKLKYRSFCGVAFGEIPVRTNLNPNTGTGGRLEKPFRHFDRYTMFGSRNFGRVGKVCIYGLVKNASEESFKEEFTQVVSILADKYGAEFDDRGGAGNAYLRAFHSDDYVSIIVTGSYENGDANYSISFENREVDAQNREIHKRHPGGDIALPSDVGADVL